MFEWLYWWSWVCGVVIGFCLACLFNSLRRSKETRKQAERKQYRAGYASGASDVASMVWLELSLSFVSLVRVAPMTGAMRKQSWIRKSEVGNESNLQSNGQR